MTASYRLLFLLPTSPLPIFTGGRLRMYEILRHLSQHHQITVLSFWRDEEARSGLEQLAGQLDITVEAVPFERIRGGGNPLPIAFRRLRTRLSEKPTDVGIWDQPSMHKEVERVLAKNPIDLIQVEWPYLAPYALVHPHIPHILVTYDIFSVAFSRRAALTTNPLSRFELQRQSQAWKRYETELYSQFVAIGAMSPVDAEIIRQRAPGANAVVLPNGVDTSVLTPGEIRPRIRNLLFVGSPTHAPNLDAACWLLTDIWPLLHRHFPYLKLTLVNLEHPKVRACLQPGVELLGRLPDLKPIYRQADIALVPLRAGSGTRLKILEAFALGVPVVSTKIGWEGLAVEPGKHLLSADSPPEFVATITQLINHRNDRESLARHARELVVERYDWSQIADLHEAMYANVLDKGCSNV